MNTSTHKITKSHTYLINGFQYESVSIQVHNLLKDRKIPNIKLQKLTVGPGSFMALIVVLNKCSRNYSGAK
jgi:hypothetical protein